MLCRIYKKNNTHRTLDQDKDDSMDDMLGPVPGSISMAQHQHGLKLQFPKFGNYSALLENEFEGMISGELASSSSKPDQLSLVASTTSNTLPLKRTLPSLYWNDDDSTGPSTAKRFQPENTDGTIGRTVDGNNSIATLLSQLPQTPSLHQLGSLGEGVFRQPFQLPGMNWYA